MSEADELFEMSESQLATAREMYRKNIDEKKVWSTIYYAVYYAAKAALLSLKTSVPVHIKG